MNNWEQFFRDKIIKIFSTKNNVIDIGGGLRISQHRGNRYDQSRKWILPLLEKVKYQILDPISKYNPDIIGDVHKLPFEDNSQEAIICLAVLEHVENPFQAVNEIYRTLKTGGYSLIYVPFLFYYHADEGYYRDYWRFTKDGIDLLFKDFLKVEKMAVRGAITTWIKLSPLGRIVILIKLANYFDKIFNKLSTSQVSGYYIFLEK